MAAISVLVRREQASRALLLSFAFCGEPAASQDSQKAEQSITHNEVRISGRRLMFSTGRRDIGCGDQSTLLPIAVLIPGEYGGGVATDDLAAALARARVGAEFPAVQTLEEAAAADM